jgi:phosphoglycolate phosphatase
VALAFDFDGVLVDSRADNIEAINTLARKYSFEPMSVDAYNNMLLFNFYEYWQMLLGAHAKEFFADLHFMPRKTPQLLPGMHDLMLTYRPVIVSSNYSMLIREAIALPAETIAIYGGDQDVSKVRKLHKLKHIPDVFVTDTVGDIREGKQAGYTIIAVTWGFNSKELLVAEKPEFLVEHPEELHAVLATIIR